MYPKQWLIFQRSFIMNIYVLPPEVEVEWFALLFLIPYVSRSSLKNGDQLLGLTVFVVFLSSFIQTPGLRQILQCSLLVSVYY
jgi:hypothetical protein